MTDEIDFIPLKNLPMVDITAYKYKEDTENLDPDQITFADNVLVGAIGRLHNVSIVGQRADGGFWFASSLSDPEEVQYCLQKFNRILEDMKGQ